MKNYNHLDILQNMFSKSDSEYEIFGEELVTVLDYKRLCHISFAGDIKNTFNKIVVQIYNKCSGLVVKKEFYFDTFFKKNDIADLKDGNIALEINNSNSSYMWTVKPTEEALKKYIKQIEKFIDLYR